MIVKAYKHEETGKLFEDLEAFNKHKVSYDKTQLKRAEEIKKKQEWESLINSPRLTATSIDDYRRKLIDVWNKVHAPLGMTLDELEFTVHWKMDLSNSHNAPIGYQTNWCGSRDKEGIPKSYPGWGGRVKGKMSTGSRSYVNVYDFHQLIDGRLREVCKVPGFNTGSGSGGHSFNFTLELFVYDFPLILKDFKDGFRSRDSLTKEIQLEEEKAKKRALDKEAYISSNEDVRRLTNIINDTETQIQKLRMSKDIHFASLNHYKADAINQFESEFPFDNERLSHLRTKLRLTEDDLNRCL